MNDFTRLSDEVPTKRNVFFKTIFENVCLYIFLKYKHLSGGNRYQKGTWEHTYTKKNHWLDPSEGKVIKAKMTTQPKWK